MGTELGTKLMIVIPSLARKQCTMLFTSYNMGSECIVIIVMYYKRGICMTTLYVTESGSFIKRKGGHVIVGRNHEVLFEVPFDSIDDVTVFDLRST